MVLLLFFGAVAISAGYCYYFFVLCFLVVVLFMLPAATHVSWLKNNAKLMFFCYVFVKISNCDIF